MQRVIAEKAGTSEAVDAEKALEVMGKSVTAESKRANISKARGDIFLNQLESRLTAAGAKVLRFRKPTFTKPAPVDLRHEIATKCTLVIEALAD